VTPTLAAELAAILRQPHSTVRAALERRLEREPFAPAIPELVELGARAERRGAGDPELLLAVATLLSFYAPPVGAVQR
jgi:hypothetical protein